MEQKKDAEEAWWIQGMNSEKARRAQCPAGFPTCFLFSSFRKSQETVLAVLTFFQALAESFILTFESLQLTTKILYFLVTRVLL